MFRAIEARTDLTERKKAIIKELLTSYRKTAKKIASYQWKLFFQSGAFNRKANIKHLQSDLSERYKYTVQYHSVVPVLEGFISNVQNKFREIVLNSSLLEKTKRVLLYLNSRKEWLWIRSEKALWIEKNTKHEYEITQEERLLAKKIFKHILKRWRKPSFKKVNLLLDSKCGLLESPEKAKHFDYWIRLCTKEKGKPIYLPVKLHGYFHSKDGELSGLIQISEDGRIKLVKEVAVKSLELSGEVALDFGMKCLLATDIGHLLGRGFYSKVKEYAEKIDKLQRNLQRQKIKPMQSKRYQKLNHRLSEYVKSEIRRILNRVVVLYRPARLVVEDLRYFVKRVINNFPKAVKRVLVRFWLGEIKRKLRELQEEYGIEVLYVNPAYTSQAFSNCGYVDKENRKSRSEFECKCFGRKLRTDVDACRNLLDRVRWGMRLYGVKKALAIQMEKFVQNLSSERYNCLCGKARGLLVGMPATVPESETWNKCPC
ncbi:MAG: transposase [Aquificaceae bacterium]|nr:transposase [Aquificaceae bacterium]